jgi:uncharacterized protein (TIGR02444 family)
MFSFYQCKIFREGSRVMPVSPGNNAELSAGIPGSLEPDNPLWRFALAFWQQPGVQENCLALQQQGWSVTKLLSAGWLALNNRRYTGTEEATVTEWRDRVTSSLRAVRQWLPKTQPDCRHLRDNLAALELNAEQIELALTWHALSINNPGNSTMQGCKTLIQHNLEAAAPFSGSAGSAASQLNTLADVLANFPKGEPQPW